MNNQYYVMRHGESVANHKGLIVSEAANALNDYGLSRKGVTQVIEAAKNSTLGKDTVIVSSDYLRAHQTADVFKNAANIHTPIEFDNHLRERDFGKWELQDHHNYHRVWKHDEIKPDTSIDGVESVMDTLKRGMQVIAKLDSHYHSKTILLIGHGDVLQILMAYQQDIEPRYHRSLPPLDNAQIRSLDRKVMPTTADFICRTPQATRA